VTFAASLPVLLFNVPLNKLQSLEWLGTQRALVSTGVCCQHMFLQWTVRSESRGTFAAGEIPVPRVCLHVGLQHTVWTKRTLAHRALVRFTICNLHMQCTLLV